MEEFFNRNNFSFEERERLVALSFSNFFKIGPRGIIKLLKRFGSLNKAYFATFGDLKNIGIREDVAYAFLKFRQKFSLEETLNYLKTRQINFIYLEDDNYPKILKEIYDPPTIIYYKGDLDFNNDKGLAIVGSRKHSAYGEKVIDSLLKDLSSSKLTIISGLASGIDSLAHDKALENNLKTIAVLGTSLEEENIFPAENFSLAKSILANNGALVSEFPPRTKGFKQNFPMRNRIISGLSQAVLVIEAKERSGSLITVNQALDQGREVMTIPGNIFSEFSSGTNKLLASGARLITKGEDILDFFLNKNLIEDKSPEIVKKDILSSKKKFKINLENENEKVVYELIKTADERAEKINTEEIVKKTKLDIATINSTLSILELKSLIKKSYNNYNLS